MPTKWPVWAVEDFNQVLERARSGCTEHTGQLLERYRDPLHENARVRIPRSLCARITPSDMVQEALAAAYKHFDQFRGSSPKEFGAWLSIILLNTVHNFVRAYGLRKKRQASREVPLDAISPATRVAARWSMSSACDRLISQEEHTAVNRCIELLPEVYRQVLRLRYHDDLTFRQIGATLGVSPEAARKLRDRALLALADRLHAGIVSEPP